MTPGARQTAAATFRPARLKFPDGRIESVQRAVCYLHGAVKVTNGDGTQTYYPPSHAPIVRGGGE